MRSNFITPPAAILALTLALAAPAVAQSTGDGGPSGYTITDITPRFELIDTGGDVVSEALLKGQWSLLFAGYTNCVQACPIALGTMAQIAEDLGGETKPRLVFVDFDAGEKGLAPLKAYAASFEANVVALTGSRKQIHAFGRDFKIRRMRRSPRPGEIGKQYHHTTRFYLLNPEGAVISLLNPEASPEALTKAIAEKISAIKAPKTPEG
ncbi:MAG: SCO family protein [Rhodobacteraceae bacterium]|nr:SCO family protein [Paracoccaceae bacterium]